MSLADLFKSKAAKLKPDPRVRWYGKLPTKPDYFGSGADQDWVVEFQDWVFKGFTPYHDYYHGRRSPTPRLPLAAGVFRLPRCGITVIASVQDYGGDMIGRPYPLCFYVGVPSEQWPGPTSNRLAPACRVLGELTALRRLIPRLNTPGRFETHFGDREVDLAGLDDQMHDDSWVQQARQIPLSDWIARAQAGLKTDDPHAWLRVVAQWGEKIAQFESPTFEPTLRFPLAAGLPVEVQTAGWLRWLESRMDLPRRWLSLMVSGDLERGIGHLSVIAREVVPEDFLLITPRVNTLAYLDDLTEVNPESAKGANETVTDPGQGPRELAGTWADFVEGTVVVT